MEDCIFCKIIRGEISSTKAYEDEQVLAFYDIDAKAPVHVLIIPKKHIQSVLALKPEDGALVAHIFEVAGKLARELGLEESGFRIVSNIGKDAGQTVPHLHFHLLGGRELGWPPG